VIREEVQLQPLLTGRLPDYIPFTALSEALGIDPDTVCAHNYMLVPPV
jgi:hypothetical protein